MNEILLFVASMPWVVVYAVAGAIAGLLGASAGLIAQKYFGLKKGWGFVPVVVFVVISFNVSQWLFQDAVPAQAVSRLKENPLFRAIFKHHPEAERELMTRVDKLLSGPREQFRTAWDALGAEFTARYVNLHTLTASDAAIHHMLQSEAAIIESLKNNPADCVAQYLNITSNASRNKAVPRSLIEASLNAKAEVIESSVVAPSQPVKASIDDIVGVLTAAYRAKGYDAGGIDELANVESLPPAEGCEVGYRFASALASMSEQQSAFVFKGLVSAGK